MITVAQVSRKTFERMNPAASESSAEAWQTKLRLDEIPRAVLIAVIVLAALAAVLGVVLFGRCSSAADVIVRDAPLSEDDTIAREDASQTGPEAADTSTSENSLMATDDDTVLLRVHISGAVMLPGVYELPEDARVLDAIEAAGGLTNGADLSSVNLAEPIYDGCKINIPSFGSAAAASDPDASIGHYESVIEEPTLSAASPEHASSGGPVNINTANEEMLQTLPGIGPVLAAAIVEDRALNGAFSSPEDLMRVSGIGEKKFAKLKDWVVV